MVDIKKLGENIQSEITSRFQGAFWGPFLLSWCLVNWKVILVIFSWNSKEIDDKIRYIEGLFFWDSLLGGVLSICKLLLFPFIGSLIAVWLIPYLTRWYLGKQIDNKKKEDEEYKKQLNSEIEVKNKQLELQKKTEKIEKNQEEEWKKEFDGFVKNKQIYNIINILIALIYTKSGNSRGVGGKNIASLESFDLIRFMDFKKDEYKNEYSFYEITEKGKFFIKNYSLIESSIMEEDIPF